MKDAKTGVLTLIGLLVVAVALGLVIWHIASLEGRVSALETRMDLQEERTIPLTRALHAQALRMEQAEGGSRAAAAQTQPGGRARGRE